MLRWPGPLPAPVAKLAGFDVRVDPRCPPDVLYVLDGDLVVGAIIGIDPASTSDPFDHTAVYRKTWDA